MGSNSHRLVDGVIEDLPLDHLARCASGLGRECEINCQFGVVMFRLPRNGPAIAGGEHSLDRVEGRRPAMSTAYYGTSWPATRAGTPVSRP